MESVQVIAVVVVVAAAFSVAVFRAVWFFMFEIIEANNRELDSFDRWCKESPDVREYVRQAIESKGWLSKADWMNCYDIKERDQAGEEKAKRDRQMAAIREAVK